jgi:PKD repeat protein
MMIRTIVHLLKTAERCGALAAFLLAAGGAAVFAAKPQGPPTYGDTVPPQVAISPPEKYHNRIFNITFSADKRAIIYYGFSQGRKMEVYQGPITVSSEGPVAVYYYGEDDAGNRSALDSMRYVLDTRPPEVSLVPLPGRFKAPVTVRIYANESARYSLLKDPTRETGTRLPDSFTIADSMGGYLLAIDSAGNRSLSDLVEYVVDTTRIWVRALPNGGLFNTFKPVTLVASVKQAQIFFTFDPSATDDMFARYTDPVDLPYGLSTMRYYAKGAAGYATDVQRARFVVDTVAPKIRMDHTPGRDADRVELSTREPAAIHYRTDGRNPTAESPRYAGPLSVPHKGRFVLKALAIDSAGNASPLFEWTLQFDKTAPSIIVSPPGGSFARPFAIAITTSEPATVLYTIEQRTKAQPKWISYGGPIAVSKEGLTVLRCAAVDEAGNRSEEKSYDFYLDTRAPQVQVHIEQNIRENQYMVYFLTDEPAKIYYEAGDRTPSPSSPRYIDGIALTSGQVLQYLAVDDAGNSTGVRSVNDLQKPLVSAYPGGGAYNRRLKIGFATNINSKVFWRMPPDTVFTPYNDSISLDDEGLHTLEFYSKTAGGEQSPIRRNEYFLDWTPPQTSIALRKGFKDSVTVFFECSENASIYYTIDGSSPLFSTTTRVACNKLLYRRDRISVSRTATAKLAFYAEDAIGNQSALTVLDLSRPRPIPSIPAGPDKIYSRFLSLEFNTIDDKAQVYYCHHGHQPTVDSALYTQPITLVKSDTIVAFVLDETGFKGDLDTLIYLIDLPPLPQFVVSPDTPKVNEVVRFDASATADQETPAERLLFRWDFDGDGVFDTDYEKNPRTHHTYTAGRIFRPTLEVKDENNRISTFTKEISVRDICPADMISVAAEGRTFCIDRYEWPNQRFRVPRTNVSWVEAKMQCFDAGKRLCSAEEWTAACRGNSVMTYPYGSRYVPGQCPAEEKTVSRSGAFPHCGGAGGAQDMVGNVWEWVDVKQNMYPMMYGGSFRSGKDANCRQSAAGTVAATSDDLGFRCCR